MAGRIGLIYIAWLFAILLSLPAVSAFPYNDTFANDYDGLVLTSSKQYYGTSADGNYYVQVELENHTGRNFNDIVLEVFYEEPYNKYFKLVNIEMLQDVIAEIPVSYNNMPCKDIRTVMDLNGDSTLTCRDSGTVCYDKKNCTYSEPVLANRTVKRFSPFFKILQPYRVEPRLTKMDYIDGFVAGALLVNESRIYRLTISPSQKFPKDKYPIEFAVVAYSYSEPNYLTVLDPESGTYVQIDDFEDNWAACIGDSDAITGAQETTIKTEGTSSLELFVDVDASGANEAGWNCDINAVDVSGTFGESSGAPSAGSWTFSGHIDGQLSTLTIFTIQIGSDASNTATYNILKVWTEGDFNTITFDATQYASTAGTPDWTALDWFRISPQYGAGTTDFRIYMDDFYAGAKVSNLSPDVNLADMNVSGINLKGGSSTKLFWSVSDGDSDSLLMDLNYSKIREDVSGSVIANDLNSDTYCTQPVGADKKFCSYDWTVPSEDDNYFINILVTDSTGETDFNSSDFNFQIDSTAPIFGDINKTYDINTSTHVNNQILYTVQDVNSDVNIASNIDIKLFGQVSYNGIDNNVWGAVRDTNISGFQLLDFKFSTIAKNGKIYDLNLGDIHDWSFFFSNSNTDMNNFIDVEKTTLDVCGDTYVSVSYINTTVDNNYLYELEFDANWDSVSPSGSLDIYDCNSTYISGDPVTDNSCLSVGSISSASQRRPDGDYFITFRTDEDTIIGTHQTTPDRNFVFVADTPCSKAWQMKYIPTPDTETFWQSTDNGTTWNLQAGTLFSEMHYFPEEQTSYFYYKIYATDSVGNDLNSVLQSDQIQIGQVAPEISITSPDANESVMGTIDISGFCEDANPADDLNVAISILNHPAGDLNTVLIETLGCNDLNFTYTWDTTTIADGTYFVDVNITDGTLSNDDNHIFFISQNIAPAVVLNEPTTGNYYERTTVSTFDINFTITDAGQGTFTVDLNYSTTAPSQGDGTVIIEDVNTAAATLTCTGAAATGLECIYTLAVSGFADVNYFISILTNDGLTTTYTAGDDFNIYTQGFVHKTIDGNCDIEADAYVEEQYLIIRSWATSSGHVTTGLNPTLSVLALTTDTFVYNGEVMYERDDGLYVFTSTEYYWPKGEYAYVIKVDDTCFKNFSFKKGEELELTREVVAESTINTSNALIDTVILIAIGALGIIIAGGLLYVGVGYGRKFLRGR